MQICTNQNPTIMKIILIIALHLCELCFTVVEQVWSIPNIELTQSILNTQNTEQENEQQYYEQYQEKTVSS